MSKFSNLRTLQTAEWAFSDFSPEDAKTYPRYLGGNMWATRPEILNINGNDVTVHVLNLSDLFNDTIGIDAILTHVRLAINYYTPVTAGTNELYLFAYYDTKVNTPDYVKGYAPSQGNSIQFFDMTDTTFGTFQEMKKVGQYFSDLIGARSDINEGDDIKDVKWYFYYGVGIDPTVSIEAEAPVIEAMLQIDLQA